MDGRIANSRIFATAGRLGFLPLTPVASADPEEAV
jgi:hypothetical protein